jgi:hypothetical protein
LKPHLKKCKKQNYIINTGELRKPLQEVVDWFIIKRKIREEETEGDSGDLITFRINQNNVYALQMQRSWKFAVQKR